MVHSPAGVIGGFNLHGMGNVSFVGGEKR